MAKAELIAAQSQYDSLVSDARRAEHEGQFDEAIRIAKAAWQHVVDMMKYEKRYEAAEFKSLPCIDLVLRLAPPLLDVDSLDELASLLKANRSIDRDASDDLAARVVDARERLRLSHQILGVFEEFEHSTLLRLLELTGVSRQTVEPIVKELVSVGVLERSGRAGTSEIRLRRGLYSFTKVRCGHCGGIFAGHFETALSVDCCPSCRSADAMTLSELGDDEGERLKTKGVV